MTKTTTGELALFFKDPTFWTAGQDNSTWYEDVVFVVDGETTDDDFDPDVLEKLPAHTPATVDGGVVFREEHHKSRELGSMDSYLRKWRKAQRDAGLAIVTVRVPADKLDDLKAFVKSQGGKVS